MIFSKCILNFIFNPFLHILTTVFAAYVIWLIVQWLPHFCSFWLLLWGNHCNFSEILESLSSFIWCWSVIFGNDTYLKALKIAFLNTGTLELSGWYLLKLSTHTVVYMTLHITEGLPSNQIFQVYTRRFSLFSPFALSRFLLYGTAESSPSWFLPWRIIPGY
jgi:hypothetical protein